MEGREKYPVKEIGDGVAAMTQLWSVRLNQTSTLIVFRFVHLRDLIIQSNKKESKAAEKNEQILKISGFVVFYADVTEGFAIV